VQRFKSLESLMISFKLLFMYRSSDHEHSIPDIVGTLNSNEKYMIPVCGYPVIFYFSVIDCVCLKASWKTRKCLTFPLRIDLRVYIDSLTTLLMEHKSSI